MSSLASILDDSFPGANQFQPLFLVKVWTPLSSLPFTSLRWQISLIWSTCRFPFLLPQILSSSTSPPPILPHTPTWKVFSYRVISLTPTDCHERPSYLPSSFLHTRFCHHEAFSSITSTRCSSHLHTKSLVLIQYLLFALCYSYKDTFSHISIVISF